MNIRLGIIAISTLLLVASCGTGKLAVKDSKNALPQTAKPEQASKTEQASKSETASKPATTKATKESSFAFVEKVNDRKVTADNIVADLTFSATMGGKDVSVPGSLHMRKDQMIRLQLFVPLLHTEVGRLEFTPDYVLVVDRLHKQYVKEDYNKLDFLRDNGLDFYALQALFWNQLFLPGKKTVGEGDVAKFYADLSGSAQAVPVTLKSGNLAYQWNADRESGKINEVKASYVSTQHGKSTLTMKYANFKALGAKAFPSYEELTFQTTATKKMEKVTMILDMDEPTASSKWSTETTLPSKYKKIEATDIFSKLFNM